MCVCVCVCVCCVCVCMCVCVCVHTYRYTYTYIYTYICMYVYTYVCRYVRTYVLYIYTYIYVCIGKQEAMGDLLRGAFAFAESISTRADRVFFFSNVQAESARQSLFKDTQRTCS